MDFPPPSNDQNMIPQNFSGNAPITAIGDFPPNNPNYQPLYFQNAPFANQNNNLYPSNNEINNYNYFNVQNIEVKDNHINNFGYFYIEPNLVMSLENQQKINIIMRPKFSFLRIIPALFFFVLFPVGGILTGMTQGACFPIIIVAFVGFAISIFWAVGACSSCKCCWSYVRYNSVNKDLEIKCEKIININLNLIERIDMEGTSNSSVFYVVNNNGEKIKFLEVPLNDGIPFSQGQKILNDFINFWKKKENISTTDKPL